MSLLTCPSFISRSLASLASDMAEDSGIVLSLAKTRAAVVVVDAAGGGEVSLVGLSGGEGEKSSDGGGGEIKIW